jgi:hypothetical protein
MKRHSYLARGVDSEVTETLCNREKREREATPRFDVPYCFPSALHDVLTLGAERAPQIPLFCQLTIRRRRVVE